MKVSVFSIWIATLGSLSLSAADRYEAETAIVDENSVVKVADTKASGGFYINMKEGTLSFKVTAASAGYYTLWATYSQPSDTNGKIQNLGVNGVSCGQISFPKIDTFTTIKAFAKFKLNSGSNTIDITKSWGWVNIDYIELTPYVATPFAISPNPVTPNASVNAKKLYGFLLANFQKKVISGVMTNTVMLNDGKYTPNTVENQVELSWVDSMSGKTPALVGVDFMHSTGKGSEGEWYKGYTNATLGLAEDVFNRGGIPAYCWHWKDPSHTVEAFYSPSSGNTPNTGFNLKNAFTDASCETPNTASDEYKAIVRDLDIVAGYLKTLAGKGIPVLWRPLHEASGKWFWWGYSGSAACKGLYRFMFDRFTKQHGLDNLIWVWTTDEAGDALNWYPGDDCVDIVGRDYYYYPREANHGSLVASFEKLKDMFGGRKIVTLSENGSVPFPDDMKNDGAGWSYFMPWYGDYTMDGWAHDNTAADWKKIMTSEYVLTLDEMPGWDAYVVAAETPRWAAQRKGFSIGCSGGFITCSPAAGGTIELYNVNGSRVAALGVGTPDRVGTRYDVRRIPAGLYIVKAGGAPSSVAGTVVIR